MIDPDRFHNRIDYSKVTFENWQVPEKVIKALELPTSTETEEGETVALTYTPQELYKAAGVGVVPYIDNGPDKEVTRLDLASPPVDEETGEPLEPTDYLGPAIGGGGILTKAIRLRAEESGTTEEAVIMDTVQTRTFLKAGNRPE